jgi:hypothetical protein
LQGAESTKDRRRVLHDRISEFHRIELVGYRPRGKGTEGEHVDNVAFHVLRGGKGLPSVRFRQIVYRFNDRQLQAKVEPLDHSSLKDLNGLIFLKVNIEGSEVEALKGLRAWTWRVKHLCIAYHDFRADRGEGENHRTRVAVINNLNALGFSLVTREADARPYVRDHIHAIVKQQTYP